MTRAGVALAVALSMVACGSEPGAEAPPTPAAPAPPSPAPGDHTVQIGERESLVHAPPTYRPGTPIPLVLVLHGRPQTAEEIAELSGLSDTADAEGFLVAYPRGVDNAWRTSPGAGPPDDVGFLRALVGELVARWSVDPARVYATGFSNGAAMSYRLGAEASDLVAAIAPISGEYGGAPAPSAPVSVISFLGNNDRYVQAILAGRRQWVATNGCPEVEPVWADATKTFTRSATRCPNGSEVVDYTVNDMGHEWPRPGNPTSTVDANTMMWEFFVTQRR